MFMPYEREYTTAEATQRTGLGERQLRRYVIDGKVRSRRAGRATFYDATDVDALAAERGRSSLPGAASDPTSEIMPATEIFQYLRERQDKLDASRRSGALAAAG
jgi:hypothetical protein